jgi:BlaI family transcriptional regulator, penicillinase repressor
MAPKRPQKNQNLPELSRLELAVMDLVWELGECSSAEVISAYQQKRPLAPTTIRTVLANLRKKGYLLPVPTIERGFRLKAAVTRESVASRSMRDIFQNLFQGSLRQAITCLLSEEQPSDQEMEEIRQIIASKTSKKKR